MAGGQIDPAGRAWQDASDAEGVARSEALTSACRRIERGELEAFGRLDTIRADLEQIEARVWSLLRPQPDGSRVGGGVRYWEVCFRVRGELLPEQAMMAYGAAEPLQGLASLETRGHAEGWTGRSQIPRITVALVADIQARAAAINAARRALAELRHGLLDELKAGNLVASCAPDPAAGLPGGILSSDQAGRLKWDGGRLCLRSPGEELTALHDPRVTPAQPAAPVAPRKDTGKSFGPKQEAEAGTWLLAEVGNRPKQTRAMWHDEAKRRFPKLTGAAFDAIWRPAAQAHPTKLHRGKPKTRTAT